MTKMGRLKKGDIFNRIAYELFGVKIGEDEEVVPSAGVSAKPDSKHPAPQQKFAPAAPVAEPAKPVPPPTPPPPWPPPISLPARS